MISDDTPGTVDLVKVGDLVKTSSGEAVKVLTVSASAYQAIRRHQGEQVEIWTDGDGKITRVRVCP